MLCSLSGGRSMGDALLTGVVSRVFGIDGGVTVSGRGVLMA